MAGHSKWANIKHKKGREDARRGKIFTKIIREIMIAAREGGGDANANPRLRAVIQKAKINNMPNDNIDRAIKKGTGDLEGVEYMEITYEGYAPAGVAVMLDILTDNKNRTAADIRNIFGKNGGNLGESGCVSYMFERKGYISVDASKYSEDQLFELALEAGADDVVKEDDLFVIYTAPENFSDVLDAIQDKIEYAEAEVSMIPQNTVKVTGEDALKVIKLIELLEDQDDVNNVYSNFDIDQSELENL
jgi:YebC/PmpR family DNA-binding regulatory protein